MSESTYVPTPTAVKPAPTDIRSMVSKSIGTIIPGTAPVSTDTSTQNLSDGSTNIISRENTQQPTAGEGQSSPAPLTEDAFDSVSLMEPSADAEPTAPEPDQKPTEEPNEDDKDRDASSDADTLGDDSEEPTPDQIKNFKNLRTKVRSITEELTQKDTELQEIRSKLEKYETGEEYPESVQHLNNRVQELSRYEKLVNLKTSPEYQDKFIKPIEEKTSKLKELGKDYGLPEEVISKAVSLENKAELNRFLSSHFDQVGALEAKTLISEVQGLQSQAKEAEAAPENSLERLVQEARAIRETKKIEAREIIHSTLHNAWEGALVDIKKEGRFKELIMKEGDPEYNKKWVEPLQTKAAQEYAKLSKALVEESGLEKLPDNVAKALAKMTMLAIASATANAQRDAAIKALTDLEKSTNRRANFERPPIGTNSAAPRSRVAESSGGSTSSNQEMVTPQGAARNIAAQLLSR